MIVFKGGSQEVQNLLLGFEFPATCQLSWPVTRIQWWWSLVTMVTFSNPRRWSWQWSWTACTEESATRASTQTQSSSTRRSASFLFVRKVLKVFKNIFQGAGRVAFSNQQSYIAAISARFVQLQHGEIDKRVEVGRMKIIESEKYLFFEHFLFFPSYNNSHQRWNHTSLTTSYATSVRVGGILINRNKQPEIVLYLHSLLRRHN